MLVIAAAVLWIGPAPMMAPWDGFTLLGESYRIYSGQVPNTDFSTPIGPLVYGLVAIGMHMQHSPSLRAVTYSQVLFLAIAASLGGAVAWRRLAAPYAAGFTIFLALLAVSDRPLGYAPSITSYAMLYNRDGWLLYATILLLVLLPRREATTSRAGLVVDGLVLGLALGLLFYDKITFFLAALVAVALGLVLGTLRRAPLLGAAAVAGLAIVALVTWLLFRIDTVRYVGDLAQAASVQLAGKRTHFLAHTLKWISPVILLSVVVSALVYRAVRRRSDSVAPLARVLVAAAYVLVSSALLSAGDAGEGGDLPALVLIPLLLIVFIRGIGRQRLLLMAGLAVLLAGTTVPIAAQDVLALGKAVDYRGYVANPPASQRLDAAPYGDFVIPGSSQWQTAYRTAHQLPAMMNDGIRLLRANIRPGDSVFALAYSNPFNMALGLPLSHCGPIWWDTAFNFNLQRHTSPECAIGDATWVIIPRLLPGAPPDITLSAMLSIYSPYLSQHYRQVTQTPNWTLLRRTS